METIRCGLCGADDTEVIFEEKDRLHGIEGTFNLVRCHQCGLIYLNPRPTIEEMTRYYPEDYSPYQYLGEHPSWFVRWGYIYGQKKLYHAVVTRVNIKKGRILDIGCSTGGFLTGMREWGGWEPYGVEINPYAAKYAQEHLGLNVTVGELFDAHYPNAAFDVVTLWNVLEHLHQPIATLSEIGRIIRPGGLLVLTVPNIDSVEAKIFGRYWAGLDAPRHLYLYSRNVIKKILDSTGFELVEVASFTGRYSVLSMSLGFWIDEKVTDLNRKTFLKRCVNSFLPRLLTLPYYFIADHLNQSSVMTIFARRHEVDHEVSI